MKIFQSISKSFIFLVENYSAMFEKMFNAMPCNIQHIYLEFEKI